MRVSKIAIASVVVVVGAVAISTVLATFGGADEAVYTPNRDAITAEGRALTEGSSRVLRTVEEPAGLDWTLVTYLSSDGVCLDAHVKLEASRDEGMLGGCGAPAGLSGYSVGGIELGGQWYTVGFGSVPVAATKVEATLADGSTVTSDTAGGVWLSAVRGETDFTRIAAKDSEGRVLHAVNPPSLTERLRASLNPEGTRESLEVRERRLSSSLQSERNQSRQ